MTNTVPYLRISDCAIVHAAAGGSRALPAAQYIKQPDMSAVEGHHPSHWKVTAERTVVLMTDDELLAVQLQDFKQAVLDEISVISKMALRMADNPVACHETTWLATDTAIACLTAALVLEADRFEWSDTQANVLMMGVAQVRTLLTVLVDHRRSIVNTAAAMLTGVKEIAADTDKTQPQRLEEIRKVRHSHA